MGRDMGCSPSGESLVHVIVGEVISSNHLDDGVIDLWRIELTGRPLNRFLERLAGWRYAPLPVSGLPTRPRRLLTTSGWTTSPSGAPR